MSTPSPQRTKLLSEGLRLIEAPIAGARSVACYATVSCGSRHETRTPAGVAHFLEHMLFKGTPRRPSTRELALEVERIGGEFNAYTGKELTSYYICCDASERDRALDVLAEMLSEPLLPDAEIEREQAVITEELKTRDETPARAADDLLWSLAYGEHPLGHSIAGTDESVRSVSRRDLTEFLTGHYSKRNVVVGVGGATGERLRETVEQVFAGLRTTAAPVPLEPPTVTPGPRAAVLERPLGQAHMRLAYEAPTNADPDQYPLVLLAIVLGGGMSSRLFSEIRERLGLAYAIGATRIAYRDTGLFVCTATVDADKTGETLRALLDQLALIAREQVSDDELRVAKAIARGQLTRSVESPQGLVSFALNDELTRDEPRSVDEMLEALDAVTVDDLERVAKKLFCERRPLLALVGPFDSPERFAAELS